jgi:hypothetical protein
MVKWVRRMIICIAGKHLRSGEPCVCQVGKSRFWQQKWRKAGTIWAAANQEERVRNKRKKERIHCNRGHFAFPLPFFLPSLPELADAISLAFLPLLPFREPLLAFAYVFVYPVLSYSTCLLNLIY